MNKFEMIDKFRDELIDEFLEMCHYNDFRKLTLLEISDTIDRIYDECIEEMQEE